MRLENRLRFALLLLLLGRGVLWGLGSDRRLAQFGVQTWQSDSGLPQNTVRAVLQTRDGYLWIATEAGLVRFDGLSFRVYDTENTPQLRSDLVNDLREDRTGDLWVSTTGGLVCESGGTFRAYTVADGLPSNSVAYTFVPKSGGLVAITSAGVAVLRDRQFVKVSGTEDLDPVADRGDLVLEDERGEITIAGSRELASLRTDPSGARMTPAGTELGEMDAQAMLAQGEIWLGGRNGIAVLKDGRTTALPGLEHLPSRDVRSLLPDGNGGMWVGTSRGLSHWVAGAVSVEGLEAFAGMPIAQLFRDREGAVWVATSRGLGRIANGAVEVLPQRSRLVGVLSIFEDREGSMWFGTENGGLTVLREQAFSTISEEDGLTARAVRAVYGDSEGTIWIGTDGGGLNRIQQGRVDRLAGEPALSSDVVLSVAKTGADLWVGTPNGLNRVRDGKVRVFSTEDGLPDDFVRSLYADRDGSLWVGTRNGLSHLVDGAFQSYSRMDGLGADLIGAILRTRAGDLWVGTLGGLSRWTGNGFVTITQKDGLGSDAVTSLLEDADGTLWIGTQGEGVSRRLRNGRIVALPPSRAGVPETVFGMLEDGSGNLWLSSRRGVYQVPTRELNRVADGGRGVVSPRIYGVADGLRISEASSGGHPAAWRMGDGSLWFATLDGVASVQPTSMGRNTIAPLTVIEGVLLNDRPVRGSMLLPGAELKVAPDERRLQVQYAGLSFVAPQKVRYRYRLVGLDRDWVDAGTRREAFYTNLSPGRYRFEVMSQNNDGVWSAEPSGFSVRVEPTLLESWWFYGLLVLATGGLIFAGYRWRVLTVEAQYKAVLQERGRIAREIHDTLAQGYVAISVQLELAGRLLGSSKEAALQQLDETKALVRSSLAEARSSIWNLRSLSETGTLPSQMAAMSESRSSAGGPAVKLEIKGTYRPVAADVELEVLRVAQEAVTNAVRHADAKQIVVELRYDASVLELRVSDDGRGFAETAKDLSRSGHFGVQGMRERAARVGARLNVESGQGQGTVVALVVDARKVEREGRL